MAFQLCINDITSYNEVIAVKDQILAAREFFIFGGDLVGFFLMTEFAGLSVMAEVPAVIINSQRGRPSTGIPTKTEQSDFNAAVSGGAGDWPRVVLAPIDTASFSSMMLSPFPEQVLIGFAGKWKKILVPELNYGGQFAKFIMPIIHCPVE